MRLLILFVLLSINLFAIELPNDLKIDGETRYIARLKTGDILTGIIVGVENDAKGDAIKFETFIGESLIYANEISELREYHENYRHKHRVFMMPTAKPIGDDHFAGVFELGLFYGGFGVYDILSVTVGRSLVPGIAHRQQLSLVNAKATLLEMPFDNYPGSMAIAVGTNWAWLNHNNRLVHYYLSTTFHGERTYITVNINYKAGSKDFYDLRVGNNRFDFNYLNGNYGLAVGIDTKFTEWHDLRFIGEFWNMWTQGMDIAPSLGIFTGIRVGNSDISADFGLSFFSGPNIVPFTSFSWTPF